MDVIEKYSLEFIKSIKSSVEPGFSIDKFRENNKEYLLSVTNGMNDQNFPLEQDFDGEITFFIFKACGNISSTHKFILDLKKAGYLLTGVKGIAHLFLKYKDFLPKDVWVLSPNRILLPSDNRMGSAIPYIVSRRAGGISLHHSNNSVTCILDGHCLVLGRK